jgi:type II secretory pathway pseudopilin PulG
MPLSRRRRGHLLAEALCALALAGVLAAAAATALGAARRALASAQASSGGARVAREAAAIAATLLRDADSIVVHGDTAATAAFLVATSAACSIEPTRRAVLLPPATVVSGPPITARGQPVEAGDIVAILVGDSIGRDAQWWHTVVDSVGERTASSPCGPLEGWTAVADASSARMRLALRDPLPAAARDGSALRATRRGRLALYSSGGEWMLGWRRCTTDGLTCGVAQPVAGPLASRSAGGLRLVLVGSSLVVQARARGPGTTAGATDSVLVSPRSLAP